MVFSAKGYAIPQAVRQREGGDGGVLVTFPNLQFSLMVRAWLILLRVRTFSCVYVCMQKYKYVWKGLQCESVGFGPWSVERLKRARKNDHIISFIHSFIIPFIII